jgi:GTA TIM-barrel-like domain
MGYVNGMNLLPSTGEFTYGTTARQGQRIGGPLAGINYYYNGSPSAETDYSVSIDQLQAAFPACQTVAIVCSWFGSAAAGTDTAAETAATCRIYPSTTYIGGSFYKWNRSAWVSENWQCSSLTQHSSGLIAISQTGTSFNYGGTPSDQSIVECITDLKARGFRVVFYPFILMDSPGKPWRGRITYDPTGVNPDITSAATAAVNTFLGSASTSQFTQDPVNKTVSYSGSPTDRTYRRMILHYANLCVVAGGADLFLLGSELRGLETIRGPAWTPAGTADGSGNAVWDYPFVAGLIQLSDDVRSVFDTAGLTKDTVNFHHLPDIRDEKRRDSKKPR